jgi:predicted DNA-binding transcriptional regulator AlpA
LPPTFYLEANQVPRKYIRFSDLKAKGVTYTRVHWNRLIDQGKAPPPYVISDNTLGWDEADIDLYLNSRPLRGLPVPVLWSPRATPVKGRGQPGGSAKSPGRPRGSRMIGGRLVRAEDLPAALAAAAPE